MAPRSSCCVSGAHVLIAVEGIDGAGKSTVAREIVERLQVISIEACYADKKAAGQVAPDIAARADALSRLIWNADAPVDRFGTLHWILLIASWYSALDRIQPLFSEHADRVVIVDGWYYRNIAKTIVRASADERWLDSLFTPAVDPDVVVLLDVDPKVVWTRRSEFTDTELGRWDGFGGEPVDAFCGYQARIRQELVGMSDKRGWVRFTPHPALTASAVAEAVVELILPRFATGCTEGIGPTCLDTERQPGRRCAVTTAIEADIATGKPEPATTTMGRQ
jgi:dTMP kinase